MSLASDCDGDTGEDVGIGTCLWREPGIVPIIADANQYNLQPSGTPVPLGAGFPRCALAGRRDAAARLKYPLPYVKSTLRSDMALPFTRFPELRIHTHQQMLVDVGIALQKAHGAGYTRKFLKEMKIPYR